MDKYEKQIREGNIKLRALIKVCNEDNHSLFNKIERISNKNWLRVSHNYDLTTLPKNYFDIVVWSGCDIEAELQNVFAINHILRPGAHIYFDNLLPAFKALMSKCLPDDSISITDESVIAILREIFPQYEVKLLEYNGERYIVIIKPLPDLRKLIIPNITLSVEEIQGLIPYNTNFTDVITGVKAEYDLLIREIPRLVSEGEKNVLKALNVPTDLRDLAKKLIEIEERKAAEEELPPTLLPGLSNFGGFSCFMDSVLVPILLPKSGYFAENICNKPISKKAAEECTSIPPQKRVEYMEDLQTAFRDVTAKIRSRSGGKCTSIGAKIKKCNDLTNALMSGEQQDDSEFLIAVMNIFNLEPTTVSHITEVSRDGRTWNTIKNTTKEAVLESRANDDMDIISAYETVKESNFSKVPEASRPKFNDIAYPYTREQYKIEDSDELILHVPRLQVQGGRFVKDTTRVSFCPYLENGSTHFELYTVTIHSGSARGGHYTAYFKYMGQWFFYDDMGGGIETTTWDDVVADGSKNGSLFIYRKLK